MFFAISLNANFGSRIFKKYLVIILVFTALLGVLSVYGGIKLNGESYVSSGELVQNDNNYNLISSYKEFVKSRRFSNLIDKKVAKSTWNQTSHKRKYSIAIDTSDSSSSPFFNLKVSSENKYFSKYVANLAMKILIMNMGKYLSGANISIVSEAAVGKVNISQKTMIDNAWHGAVVGFILSSLIFISSELFVGKIKDRGYMHDAFSITKLGTIENPDRDRK